MNQKGLLFGNRLVGWYSIDVITRLRDGFKARGWSLEHSKATDVVEKSIKQYVLTSWEKIEA